MYNGLWNRWIVLQHYCLLSTPRYAHTLDPVSFIVWDNLSSLNTALRCLADTEVLATDESGSDSDGGSSSSSFSSLR